MLSFKLKLNRFRNVIADDGTNTANGKEFWFSRHRQRRHRPHPSGANDKRIYYEMENGIIIVDVINTKDLLSRSLLTGDDYYDYHNVNVA